MKKVAILMGSYNDFETVKPAAQRLKSFGIELEMRVISAHRTPHEAAEFAENAEQNGFGVIIAAAGKAAHLAGVLAAHTILPVIGIPVGASLNGLDALLATVQMPPGIPVATVAVDGAENAAILAAQVLAVGDVELTQKLRDFKAELREKALEKDKLLQKELQI